MATLASTQKTVTMSNHADCFPFLQLPGELRNQVYCNVFRLDEIPYVKLLLPETLVCSSKGTISTSWALTQVNKQLCSELLPLVHPTRFAAVALCDLADYIQTLYTFRDGFPAEAKEQLNSFGHSERKI
ncbi:hypothetical protein PMIN02_001362 [Paraphaeosphaeria minitans]